MRRGSAPVIATIAAIVVLGCGPGLDTPGDPASSETGDDASPSTSDGATWGPPSADSSTGVGWGTAYEDDGGSDDGCTFTCPPPPGPPNNGGIGCSFWGQDCPDGEKCMPWANDGGPNWNSTRCAPIAADPAAPGEPCQIEGSFVSGIDDCEPGAICLPDDFAPRDGQGTCQLLCQGVCTQAGDVCVQLPAGIPHCTHPCDPLDTDACGGGRVCASVVPHDGSSAFVCQPTLLFGPFVAQMPCEFANACLPGQYCAPAPDVPGCGASLGCCANLCDLEDPATCPAASSHVCEPIGALPGTMWQSLGICVVQ